MEGETPSADQNLPRDDKTPRVSSALHERECNAEVSLVPMAWVLPDDLSKQILAYLPFADLVICLQPSYEKTERNCAAPEVEDVTCTPPAITVSRTTPSYRVSIVTTKDQDLPGVPVGRELSIRLYSSQPRMWVTCMTEVLIGWRSGYESVICDGVLYFSIYQTGYVSPWHGDGLVMYDLSGRCSNDLLASFVPVPCPLPRGFLMNMKEKLVLVGDISEDDRASFMSMKGVGIWVLNGREWHEIARMPDDLFLGFGSDPWIRSSGLNDLIYILSERGPYVVTFDMNQKQWSRNSLDKVPTDICDCCCFEPWLEIAP
ncbi:hypothetical protein NL676_023503 [Syzygium grande]|nr:hypothetical protein NL676_023503 [Syzygium grande]